MEAASDAAVPWQKKSWLDCPPAWLPHVVLITCQLAFAIMQVTSKLALEYIPPCAFAAMRVSAATPLLFLLAYLVEPGPLRFSPRYVAKFAFLGFTGVYLPQGLIFWGVALVGPAIVAIMQPTIPVYVAIISVVMRYESATALKAAGILLAVSGAVVELDVTNIDVSSAQTSGVLIMILQTVSYAVFIVTLSRVVASVPRPFTVFAWASLFGAIYLTCTAVYSLVTMEWGRVPWHAWLTLAYCSFGVSFGAHGSVSWAVRHISPTVPSLYACLQPLFVTILDLMLYGGTLATKDWVGMSLILSGLFLTVYEKHRSASQSTPAGEVGVELGALEVRYTECMTADGAHKHAAGNDAKVSGSALTPSASWDSTECKNGQPSICTAGYVTDDAMEQGDAEEVALLQVSSSPVRSSIAMLS